MAMEAMKAKMKRVDFEWEGKLEERLSGMEEIMIIR